MMNEADEPSSIDETESPDKVGSAGKANPGSSWKIRLGVLCTMLVLALVGMGLTQSSESGAWEFWLFVVVVYAALGLWRSVRSARHTGHSVNKSILRELTHWGILIAFLAVLLFLERREIINRDSASYFALMLLALSCCMAGLHVDWLLLVVGVVLTIMLVAMATLEQFTVVLWLIMVAVVALASAFFYIKSKTANSDSN
jgi:general stress protein CsbA